MMQKLLGRIIHIGGGQMDPDRFLQQQLEMECTGKKYLIHASPPECSKPVAVLLQMAASVGGILPD